MAVQTDKLVTQLEVVGLDKSVADVNKYRAAIQTADSDIRKLTANELIAKSFDKQIAAVERRTLGLASQLNQLGKATIGVAGLDGLGRAAGRAESELRATYARLTEIEAEMAKTRDPVLLKLLQAETLKANADLDKLETKIARVGAGRQAAAARNPSAPSINGRGLLSGASAAGVPYAYEASLGLDAAAAAGITTASLAALGAVAVAGVAIVKLSQQIKAEAEKRLKVEEDIAAAGNKYVLAGREVLKNFEKQRAEAAFQRQLQKDIAGATIAELERRRDLAAKLLALDPNGPFAQQNQEIVLRNEAAIADLRDKSVADADAAFNQRNERFKESQKQAAEFEKKQLESVNAGRARIDELGKSTDAFFAGLFAKKGSDNPFVAVFSEADRAIESTRLNTATLTDELKRQAEQLTANQNAAALFSARIDARINAANLRGDAAAFRNGGGTAAADKQAADAIARFRADLANGTFRNPDNLNIYRQGTGAKTGLQLFDFQRAVEQAGGLFRNPDFDAERRRQIAASDPTAQTAADRLERQLSSIRDLKPQTDAERAITDRRIIALTSGLNPADLTDAQRNVAAAARENEAVRLDAAEKAAIADRKEALDAQKAIDKNIKALLDKANSDGLVGIIRIINEAEDAANVSIGKRPTTRDVKSLGEL